MMKSIRAIAIAAAILLPAAGGSAQVRTGQPDGDAPPARLRTTGESAPEARQPISLNFPENLELSVLADYVADRLGINILYSQDVANKRVTILAPEPVTQESLLGLFRSALKMHSLALIDTEDPNWKQIAPTADLVALAGQLDEHDPTAGKATGGKPGVESGGGPGVGPITAVTRVFTLQHVQPRLAEQMIKTFLTKPGGNSVGLEEQQMLIVTDLASNMQRITRLLELVDQPPRQVVVEFVPVQYIDGAQLAGLIKKVVAVQARAAGEKGSSSEQLEVIHDPQTNDLAVIGPRSSVAEAVEIIRDRDIPIVAERSPIRFHKLMNTKAADVLATIRAMEGNDGLGLARFENASGASPSAAADALPDDQLPIPTRPPDGDTPAPMPAGQTPVAGGPSNGEVAASIFDSDTDLQTIETARARITADTNTNTLIVVADPITQQLYAGLIERLDQRRPQVLIETTIVNLDTSDGFQFGIEISAGEEAIGGDRSLTFSSFGLSTVDAETGRLTLKPGVGFNGALVSADIADIVIKALKRTGRATVTSAPRILVNDNATGELDSTSQEPYESVNAGDTISTTSFGGFVEAGTKISLTPHISEDDYLNLEYTVALSSFTGDRVENLPPPRQEDKIKSEVMIPDGYTIIAGGLNRRTTSETIRMVPLLGDLPLIGALFTDRVDSGTAGTLFVFIRATILRDDTFADLKFLSQRDLAAAEEPGYFPDSDPMLIR